MKKTKTKTKSDDDAVQVAFTCTNDDRERVAVYLLLVLIEEEDWYEEEEPTVPELAKRVSKTWVRNELRAQLQGYGQSYALRIEKRLDKPKHSARKRQILKAATARIAELFPASREGRPLIEVL